MYIALTYFQPSVVLQLLQNMSATACNPVSNILSSALPQSTLILMRERDKERKRERERERERQGKKERERKREREREGK